MRRRHLFSQWVRTCKPGTRPYSQNTRTVYLVEWLDLLCVDVCYTYSPAISVSDLNYRDDVIDSFETFPRAAEQESEAIEDQVFIARIDDVKTLILQVDILRKKITHITRCLHGKVDILNDFIKRSQAPDKHPIFPDGDIALYLGDVQDHLVTTLSTLSHIDEVISHCQTTCLAQLSATNFRVSLTINSVISKVTVLAAIFVPLHLVTSIFGMNVRVPGQNTPGLSWFFGIVGCFAAFMVICIGIAVRFKLL